MDGMIQTNNSIIDVFPNLNFCSQQGLRDKILALKISKVNRANLKNKFLSKKLRLNHTKKYSKNLGLKNYFSFI